MGTMRFVLWTTCCVAVGVGLGTVEFGGGTAVQHVERFLHQKGPRLEKLKEGATGLVDEVKKKVSAKEPASPTEQHSPAERNAIDQIIAKRQK